MTTALTQSQMLLKAASVLVAEGLDTFSLAALVVKSFELYPDTFGLHGFAHPHSAKVISVVVGEKGLRKRGLLYKAAPNVYGLTREGEAVVALQEGRKAPDALPGTSRAATAREDVFLTRLLGSDALRKCDDGHRLDVTFVDACTFWGVKEPVGPALRSEAFAAFGQPLQAMAEELEASGQTLRLATGRDVTVMDVRVLLNVHGHLLDRFDRLLKGIQMRVRPCA